MSEIIVPEYSAHLPREFFARRADHVAVDLLGRTIVGRELRGEGKALIGRIREVSAWEGKERTSTESLDYAPGMIGVSKKYGRTMIDIATNGHRKASCITLVGLETPEGVVQGPGSVSEYLQVGRDFDSVPIDSPLLWIGGEPIGAERIQVRNKKDTPSNCIGYFYFK